MKYWIYMIGMIPFLGMAQITPKIDSTAIDSTAYIQLNDVVITASRKKESIKEVPSTVNIVDAQEIQEQMDVNPELGAVLATTIPGFGSFNSRSLSTGQNLRGRGVLVMIDGIPQSTPLRNGSRDLKSISGVALDHIEVIKGATAIYGNGADGGIINYITKKPTHKPGIHGTSQFGLTGQTYGGTLGYSASQLLTGKFDQFDFVANLYHSESGDIKDANGDDLAPQYSLAKIKEWSGLVKLGYDISQKQRIEFSYTGYRFLSDLDLGTKVGEFGKIPTIGEGKGHRNPLEVDQGTPKNNNFSLSYTNNQLFGQTGLKADAYYQDFHTVYFYSDTFKDGGQSNLKSRKKGIRINLDTPYKSSKDWKGEVIYGADILNDVTTQKLEDGRYWTPEMDMLNLAPFAMIKSEFFKDLIVKVGARYENARVKTNDFYTLPRMNNNGEFPESIFVEGGKLTYNAFMMNAGIRYNLNPHFNFLVSWSQSFSINELGIILRTATESILDQLPTDPIIVNSYELGVSGKFYNRFSYELTSYISTSKLGSTYITGADGNYAVQRTPEIIYGTEAMWNYKISPMFEIGGNFSYMKGREDLDDDGQYEDDISNLRIKPTQWINYITVKPTRNWSFKILADSNFKKEASGKETAPGKYGYGEAPIPAKTIFSLNSSYDVNDRLSLRLGINNLFNKLYQPEMAWMYAQDSDFTNAAGARGTFTVSYKF